jgi:hypothetical protein
MPDLCNLCVRKHNSNHQVMALRPRRHSPLVSFIAMCMKANSGVPTRSLEETTGWGAHKPMCFFLRPIVRSASEIPHERRFVYFVGKACSGLSGQGCLG